MSQYDDTNRGSIWKNDKKETDRHPDFTGTLNVEGVEYWVSAWKRKPDANPKAPALSFSVKPKDKPAAATDAHNEAKQNGYQPQPQSMSDEIPF